MTESELREKNAGILENESSEARLRSKNSSCQRWIKRETGWQIRNCWDAPVKWNFYRRLFDYWWALY